MDDRQLPRGARSLLIVGGAYVAAQMMADIASLRIISIAGHAVDAGTLIYPFTFTLRDLVHKIGGKDAARTLIFLAAGINVVMAGFFWLVARWPADPVTGQQPGFGEVLSPVWGIVLASIVAEVVSELIDTEAYQRWIVWFGERRQWGRVLFSNAIAIPVDSAIFVGLATSFGIFPADVAWSIFWVNVVIKALVTVISIPWIYWVRPEPLAATSIRNAR
ncbi:MAG TPA: queuosine precursor transporter [Acidimicrobiia bacterium]|nr:queuosine precursor transporter [Acidimicrobiia bacterium]